MIARDGICAPPLRGLLKLLDIHRGGCVKGLMSIICGPSCAGKSTFISDPRSGQFTGHTASAPIIFPANWQNREHAAGEHFLFHYNTLRTAGKLFGRGPGNAGSRSADGYTTFGHDAAWQRVITSTYTKQAVVLIASRAVLEERMSARLDIEPKSLGYGGNCLVRLYNRYRSYPGAYWRQVLFRIDLEKLYQAWCEELHRQQIPFTLLNSCDHSYASIAPDDLRHMQLNAPACPGLLSA